MFPPEIWKECFGDSPKKNIKILITLSKDLSSTFQPLLYRDLHFVWEGANSKIHDGANDSIEESVVRHFTKKVTSLRGDFKDVSWEDYLAQIIRGGRRFILISTDPRLAGFVRTCRVEGPRSTFPAALAPRADSLAGVIETHYQSALEKMFTSLSNFRNLRELTIQSLDITSQVLRHIEQIPNLTDLTFTSCLFDNHPGAFHPPRLTKFKFSIYGYVIWPEADPKPEWAFQVAAILPTQTLKELTFDIKNTFHYQELRIFVPLQRVGTFPCLQTLFIPIPRNVEDARALIAVLENSPNLSCLELQDPDLRYPMDSELTIPYHQLPDVSRCASPLLGHLVAPIQWARLLVPGRPVRTLKVFRTLIYDTEPHDSYYEIYDPFSILQILSKTSSRVEALSLPFVGNEEDFHILEVIGRLFPFVKVLTFVLPDAGLDHIPEATPSPPPSPHPVTSTFADVPQSTSAPPVPVVYRVPKPPPFVPPPIQEIHEALVQVHHAVNADLARAPVSAYKAAVPICGDIYGEVWHSFFECPPSRTTEDVAYPNTTFPGAIYHAARYPDEWPPSIHHQAAFSPRASSRGKTPHAFLLSPAREGSAAAVCAVPGASRSQVEF